MAKQDKELEEFRSLMEPPGTFDEGFKLSSLLGAIFVAMVMVPGSLYMELIAGVGVGPAAQWVTVILFIEIAKRANAKLSRAELFVLFYMSGSIMSQTIHATPLFRQFLVNSEAASAFGLTHLFAEHPWIAPPAENESYELRTFFHTAWLPFIGLFIFQRLLGKIDNTVMGYGLFRRCSDIERLPFPMAPIGAQGLMALADDVDDRKSDDNTWRWRVFSMGGAIGLIFGGIYIGLPAISGAIFDEPFSVFPIPFFEGTPYTEGYLPAVATGLVFDLGQIIIGMVIPFFAALGSFVGAMLMLIFNPVLYHTGVLTSWEPGMTTVQTLFENNVDFYMSFTIGVSLAVAIVGISSAFKLVKNSVDGEPSKDERLVPEGRGDIPNLWIIGIYLFCVSCYIFVSAWLIGFDDPAIGGVMALLFFYGFLYTPLISYVTARLEGLAGQVIEIPFIRELSFILSGYKGVAIWFIPVPQANYGIQTVFYRKAELTGTRFTCIWKADVVLFPIVLLSMIGFSSFIWSLGPIPSPTYPYAQEIWEFEAKNASLIFSSTLGEYSRFHDALTVEKVGTGFGIGMVLYGCLTWLGAPTMLFYGLVRGMSGMMFHMVLPQFIGAMVGRYYFKKKFGDMWQKYIVVLSAGYFVGAGLISMFCIGIRFLMGATSSMPY